MDQEPDSWIKAPAFDWTPEIPLLPERGAEPVVAAYRRAAIFQPAPEAPAEQPAASAPPGPRKDQEQRLEPKAFAAEPKFTSAPFVEPRAAERRAAEPRFENPAAPEAFTAETFQPTPKPKPAPPRKVQPRFTPARAEVAAPRASLFLARMAVGLAQGTTLFALFSWRAGLDPFVFSAALMVLLFAPLLLLAGLGRMNVTALLVWTLLASVLLAGVGTYHHWRTLSSDGGHPGFALLALTSLFLFIGQAVAQGKVGDYGSYYRGAWQLAIRIVLCVLFAGLAWAALGAASGLMRAHFPMLQFSPLILPLVALSAALAAQLTGEKMLGALQEGLVFVFILALPLLLLLAIAVACLAAPGFWRPSLTLCLILGAALIIAINASYRDGASWRPYWQRRLEFAGSLLLVPLVLVASLALAARVQHYGWTDARIFGAAGLLLMSGYALCYAGSALISLGGGGWMQRIEGSNLALSFAGLMLIAALASPIADPARLAVASQTFRLEQHQIAADAFDFTWLRDGGLRFGREALTDMAAAKSAPAMARGAFLALGAPPQAARPTPTEIGANIRVHSGAGLPASLLTRDWSGVEGAPPCLSTAALTCDAFFTDLDSDGQTEILLAYGSDARWWASVMKQGSGGGWYVAGTMAAPPCPGSLTALRNGQFTAVRPAGNWRDLLVNGIRLSVNRPVPPSGCPSA